MHRVNTIHLIYTLTIRTARRLYDIKTCELSEGSLPSKQRKLVLAWAEIHQDELLADWELASNGELPFVIEPLK